jgi:hypothetical protein
VSSFFDEYLAVHIENLAGGPSTQDAAPPPPNPTTPRGAVQLSEIQRMYRTLPAISQRIVGFRRSTRIANAASTMSRS